MLQDIATIYTPWASSFDHIKFPFTDKKSSYKVCHEQDKRYLQG